MKTNRWITISYALLVLSVLTYAGGIYIWQARSVVCGDYFGLNGSIVGSGIAGLAAAIFGLQGYILPSRKLFAFSILTFAFAGVMYFFVGVMAVGCSGV